MTIEAISATPFSLPLLATFHAATHRLTRREGFIIRLATDAGIVGVGEASPHPARGPAGVNRVATAFQRIAPRVLGAPLNANGPPDENDVRSGPGDPEPVDSVDRWLDCIGRRMPPALTCALDVAARDAVAQMRGVRLAHMLGGRIRTTIPVNAVIGARTPAAVHEEVNAARVRGSTCVKLKVGACDSVAAERDRVAAAREALGDGATLRLDANGAWSPDRAIETIHALERYDLELVEQPVRPGNLEAMAQVRREVAVPIAVDEDVRNVATAQRVLARRAAQILIVKPMVVGGLGAARRIASLAEASGARVIVTTTIDAGVGTAAALHLAATLPDDGYAYGLATGSLLARDIIKPPLVEKAGTMTLPAGVGLGVHLDDDALARPLDS